MKEQPDEYLIEHVRSAIADDERVAQLDVDVAIKGGEVFLSGVAPTEERRTAIEEQVRTVIPDRRVHNSIAVETLGEPTEPEVLP